MRLPLITKKIKHNVAAWCLLLGLVLIQLLLGASAVRSTLRVYDEISDEPTNVRVIQRRSSAPVSVPVYEYSEITFTNIGWFHPSPEIANTTFRCMVARSFMDAVVAHERFNRSMWTDLERTPDATRPVLAFLDYDACNQVHWPKFGGDRYTNADMEHGRPAGNTLRKKSSMICSKIEQALQSPAMAAPESRLIVLSCAYFTTGTLYDPRLPCMFENRNATMYDKLVVGHVDTRYDAIHPKLDFGLPPWPVKTVHMPTEKIQALKDCQLQDDRPIEISFKGRQRIPFPEFHEYFEPLNDGHRRKIHFGVEHYLESPHNTSRGGKVLAPAPRENQTSESYYAWIMNTTFCPTPRGDNLYSVRFSEVMSAACIPMVYADGWVLPYNQDIVPDWSKLAVLLPQRNVSSTLDVIARITEEERCKMQKRVFDFYNKYVKDSHGRLRANLKNDGCKTIGQQGGERSWLDKLRS